MTTLTIAAALALAAQCVPPGAAVDPALIVATAQRESGLDPAAINTNTNGSRDVGLMQINERNFALLGLDDAAALDPCQSIAGAVRMLELFSRYNTGSPTHGIASGYAANVLNRVHTLKAGPSPSPPKPSCDPTGWHIVAGCTPTPLKRHEP